MEAPLHVIVCRGHEYGGNDMSHVRRFDHVGITVADLDAATRFFVALGLKIEEDVRGGRVHRHCHRHPRIENGNRNASACGQRDRRLAL